MSQGLLTYEDLAGRWGVHVRQAKRIAKKLKLPALDMGYRTRRFRPADVDRAEERAAGLRSRKAHVYGER